MGFLHVMFWIAIVGIAFTFLAAGVVTVIESAIRIVRLLRKKNKDRAPDK